MAQLYSARSLRTSGVHTVSSIVSLRQRLFSTICRLLIPPTTVLEHGSERHRSATLQHLLTGLLEFATNEQGAKSVTKALKEGGKSALDLIVERMCEPAKGYVYHKPATWRLNSHDDCVSI